MFQTKHPNPNTFNVDNERFETDVLEASHKGPIMVDFWADWCAPCHALSPHLERAINEYKGAIRLAKVEVDEGDNMKLAGHYRLRGFPTVILFQEGEERGRFSGSRSTHQLRDWIQEHLQAEVAAIET
ncbi:MAG: thioredoxin domain-containing protein [Pseudomonadota bacterium]|nr:thioredoxin domain-containing protein [Pseudomonadota bacterium]